MPEAAWRAPQRAPGPPRELDARRFFTFVARALLLRCPSCGRAGILAELAAALLILLALVLTWPEVPWKLVQYGGVALVLIMPLLFFPFSRTLWLAVHLAFHPPTETDFAEGT
ncbi:MAG: hypothetical protein WEB88_15875 [Gemmatimonadota bacterium]